jgi:acetyl-CoA carboxylase biotin carboxylase subunit
LREGINKIQRLLIANRGEIAVRIIRACKELGITSVAVASEADGAALHTREADEVVFIGPALAQESYLAQEKILSAARERKCNAVHPGYGFLSQNPAFADAVTKAGMIWVGPPPSAMRLMGDKPAARSCMEQAGVPVVPGFQGEGTESVDTLAQEAALIGFPLLVKAAAGGGGKGMRIVRNAESLGEAVEGARHEARASFGDDRIFLERFVEHAHHIEVQVLADSQGQVVHLFERECSIQRRYQKIIEEAPSPIINEETRDKMTRTAVTAAKACGYVNAGTVEFLYNPSENTYFFLEMNTRLQVEHPLTEWITGIDLVKAQLHIAEGNGLPWKQDEIKRHGHAIECRIYAESPGENFAPSTGVVLRALWPQGPGIRVDQGVESGDQVSVYYDPLLSKITAFDSTRESALSKMLAALTNTAVLGIDTNLRFLSRILSSETYRSGRAHTTFIEENRALQLDITEENLDLELICAALLDARDMASPRRGNGHTLNASENSSWSNADGFRLGSKPEAGGER